MPARERPAGRPAPHALETDAALALRPAGTAGRARARHNSPNEHLVNYLWTEQQRMDARAAHQQHARHLAWHCHARCSGTVRSVGGRREGGSVQ